VVEITLYSVHSCTMNQSRDLRIWSGLEDRWELQQQHEQEHYGCVEDDLTAI